MTTLSFKRAVLVILIVVVFFGIASVMSDIYQKLESNKGEKVDVGVLTSRLIESPRRYFRELFGDEGYEINLRPISERIEGDFIIRNGDTEKRWITFYYEDRKNDSDEKRRVFVDMQCNNSFFYLPLRDGLIIPMDIIFNVEYAATGSLEDYHGRIEKKVFDRLVLGVRKHNDLLLLPSNSGYRETVVTNTSSNGNSRVMKKLLSSKYSKSEEATLYAYHIVYGILIECLDSKVRLLDARKDKEDVLRKYMEESRYSQKNRIFDRKYMYFFSRIRELPFSFIFTDHLVAFNKLCVFLFILASLLTNFFRQGVISHLNQRVFFAEHGTEMIALGFNEKVSWQKKAWIVLCHWRYVLFPVPQKKLLSSLDRYVIPIMELKLDAYICAEAKLFWHSILTNPNLLLFKQHNNGEFKKVEANYRLAVKETNRVADFQERATALKNLESSLLEIQDFTPPLPSESVVATQTTVKKQGPEYSPEQQALYEKIEQENLLSARFLGDLKSHNLSASKLRRAKGLLSSLDPKGRRELVQMADLSAYLKKIMH